MVPSVICVFHSKVVEDEVVTTDAVVVKAAPIPVESVVLIADFSTPELVAGLLVPCSSVWEGNS